MAVIDLPSRAIRARIVYAGPSAGGKTTNLRAVAAAVPASARGQLQSLDAADGRTLVLDELPLDLGDVGGWRFLVDLASVPGQEDAASARLAVLSGADAVIFVADSDPARQAANRDSLSELRRALAPEGVPVLLQVNKRDLPDAIPAAALSSELGRGAVAVVPASALRGEGVLETLRAACREVARNL